MKRRAGIKKVEAKQKVKSAGRTKNIAAKVKEVFAQPKYLKFDPDQEIKSDTDEDQQKIENDPFFAQEEQKESADHKKVRLARKILSSLHQEINEEDLEHNPLARSQIEAAFIAKHKESKITFNDPFENVNTDPISRKLREQILLKQGKYFLEIAANLKQDIQEHFYRGHLKTPTCVDASLQGDKIYSGGKDCCIWIWDADGQKECLLKGEKHNREQNGHFDQVLSVALSSDERSLLSGGKDRLINVWDLRTEKVVKKFRGHRDYITGVKFDPQNNQFYSVSADRCLKLWSFRDMMYLDSYYGHRGLITDIDTLSRDRVMTSSHDGQVLVWKINEESQLVYKPSVHFSETICSLSDAFFVTGGQHNSVSLWSLGKKKPIKTQREAMTDHFVTSLSCVKNTDLFCSGSTDGFLRVYKHSKGERDFELLRTLGSEKPRSITAVKAIQKGERVVVAEGEEQKLGRWMVKRHAKPGIRIYKII